MLQSLVQLGVLVAIWITFARRDRTREELVRYAAAAVVAFVALGKVLSPQFLIWLIPLVAARAAVERRRSSSSPRSCSRRRGSRSTTGATRCTSSEAVTWLVLLRDLVLLALLVASYCCRRAREACRRCADHVEPWPGS